MSRNAAEPSSALTLEEFLAMCHLCTGEPPEPEAQDSQPEAQKSQPEPNFELLVKTEDVDDPYFEVVHEFYASHLDAAIDKLAGRKDLNGDLFMVRYKPGGGVTVFRRPKRPRPAPVNLR